MPSAQEEFLKLREALSLHVIGQLSLVERLLISMLADGHLLVEGLPGLAKTRAIKALAHHLEADLSRIQFTPDLLPSDITGTEVYHQSAGEAVFRFEEGPIFANLVLADEINRAPAKVQAALLEAMEERQVTVASKTHALPPLFLVMATQNPIEQEGTYPLPEAQTDRFLMKVLVEYPDTQAEKSILALVRGESAAHGAPKENLLVSKETVFRARSEIAELQVSDAVDDYIVALVEASRYPDRLDEELATWIELGGSPRATIALDRCARAHAWLRGRDHVTPDDVRAVVHDCLRHRLALSYEAEAEGLDADRVLSRLVELVAVA